MLNRFVLMGRLTRDPELRYTQSQLPVVSFRVAVDRDYGGRDSAERQTDFIDCVAWRSTAEFVSKYFTKGSMAVVDGQLIMHDWTDRNGNKHRNAEVVVSNVYFADSKPDRGGEQSSYGGAPGEYGQQGYGHPSGNHRPAASAGGYGRQRIKESVMPQGCGFTDLGDLADTDEELPF